MKKIINIGIFFVIALAVFLLVRKEGMQESQGTPALLQQKAQQTPVIIPVKKSMRITSAAFNNNEHIPFQYTCDGANINPPLAFADVPADAKSLALIVDDPDAPGGEWVHWTVWNIDPRASGIAEHSSPAGAVEGTTDFKKPGYGGPCPPDGTHHYNFKLYALDAKLDLQSSATKTDLEKAMQGHIIEQAELAGLYARGY